MCGSLGEAHMVQHATLLKCLQKANVQRVFKQMDLRCPWCYKEALRLVLFHTWPTTTISFRWSGGGHYNAVKSESRADISINCGIVSAAHAVSHTMEEKSRDKLLVHCGIPCFKLVKDRPQAQSFKVRCMQGNLQFDFLLIFFN